MASVSYYQTLQVTQDASPAEIAAAYRRLARLVHPDLNPAPDAHRRMQIINEAYNTLRHPDRRRKYDATLTPPVSPPAAPPPPPNARTTPQTPPPSRAHAAAWLSYQKRIGAEIVFTIGHADAMAALLADLQRRIPPAGRRYDIAGNRWHVAVDYEDVLRTLFRNYAPVMQAAAPAPSPRRTPPSDPPRVAQPYHRDRRTVDRRTWGGLVLAVAAALSVYALIFNRVVLPETTVASAVIAQAESSAPVAAGAQPGVAAPDKDATIVFPDDCADAQAASAPTYFQEACKTLDEQPALATPPPERPFALTTTRVASNIRSGPDTRFPVLTTAPPGARLQLAGYTISRGYVWYVTNFGGWIRSDLLTEAPAYLPMVGKE
jgi:hypothetical protein